MDALPLVGCQPGPAFVAGIFFGRRMRTLVFFARTRLGYRVHAVSDTHTRTNPVSRIAEAIRIAITSSMSRIMFALGTALRETGQALDRVGCSMQGSSAFRELISKHKTCCV